MENKEKSEEKKELNKNRLSLLNTLIIFVGFVFTITYSKEETINPFFGWFICAFIAFSIAAHGYNITNFLEPFQKMFFFLVALTFPVIIVSFFGAVGALSNNYLIHVFIAFVLTLVLSFVFFGKELIDFLVDKSRLTKFELYFTKLTGYQIPNLETIIEQFKKSVLIFLKDINCQKLAIFCLIYALYICTIIMGLLLVVVVLWKILTVILFFAYPF
jgi:hypothetical protein